MGVVKKLHNDLGASDIPASITQDIAELLRFSQKSVVEAMFGRPVSAFK